MKRNFFVLALLCSTLFPALSFAKAYDTCYQIPGSWTGYWSAFGYNCRVFGDGYKDGENVYFNFRVANCPNLQQNFAMSGKCRNGKVILANSNAVMTGLVIDGRLSIQGNNQFGNLTRF